MTRLRLTSLVVFALVFASCGSGANVEDVVLVSRVAREVDDFGCQDDSPASVCVRVEGLTMHTADGRTAVSEPVMDNWGPKDGFSCPPGLLGPFGPRDPQTPTSVFVFEDGGRVELYTHTWCAIDGFVDESGEWRGVGGSFSGQSGSYRYNWDGLQSELVLQPS